MNYFSDKSKCLQTICFDNILCLSLKITVLPQTNCLLLACGLSNSKVQLYINDYSSGCSEFVVSHSLMGHEDWIRSLDFISESKYLHYKLNKCLFIMFYLYSF